MTEILDDDNGNRVLLFDDGKVELRLKEQKPKSIGRIKEGTLIVARNRERHFFQKIGGWGFNFELIQFFKDKPLMPVIVKVSKEKIFYVTTIKDILEKGIYQDWRSKGYERQLILKQSYMDIGI